MDVLLLSDYLVFSAILFDIGLGGIFINRNNFILVLICLELMLLAINTNFIAFAKYNQNDHGQILVFFILAIAAIKTAVGLAILMLFYKRSGQVAIDTMNTLKG